MTAFVPVFLKILIGDTASMPLGLPGSAFVAIFGNVSISTFTTVSVGIINTFVMGMQTLDNYLNYKELKRKIKGLYNEKKELEKHIVIEKQKLVELQESKKSKGETEQFLVRKVDDNEILEALNAYLLLYYDCGYNEDKYYRYMEKGILYKKLGKYYTETGIEEIEYYLVNRQKDVTVKTRKRKK